MCCPLCEEPVRSVLFGLAGVGVVAIVRLAQKALKRFANRLRAQRTGNENAAPASMDAAP